MVHDLPPLVLVIFAVDKRVARVLLHLLPVGPAPCEDVVAVVDRLRWVVDGMVVSQPLIAFCGWWMDWWSVSRC